MRTPKQFSRWKGTHPAGTIAFGGDTTPPTGQPDANADNYFAFPACSNQGYPVRSLLVLWCSNPGIVAPLTDTIAYAIWLWEARTGTWNRWSGSLSPTVTANVVGTFPIQSPQSPLPQSLATQPTGGSVEGYIIMSSAPNGDADFSNGEYVFAVAPNMND